GVDMRAVRARGLRGVMAAREAEGILKEQAAPPWLFVGGMGDLSTRGAFWQNIWRPLLRRAGLRYRKPHTLRHTYASLLIQGGESLAYIRDQLGHHWIKLTVDTYGHPSPGPTGPPWIGWMTPPEATSTHPAGREGGATWGRWPAK